MDTDTVITLLTVTVMLLSIVIVGLLVTTILVLIKVRQMTKKLNVVFANAAQITQWFTPAKLFAEARRAFRK